MPGEAGGNAPTRLPLQRQAAMRPCPLSQELLQLTDVWGSALHLGSWHRATWRGIGAVSAGTDRGTQVRALA